MKVALIDYGMGNLLSVAKAFESLGAEVALAATPDALEKAGAVVLPGVGNFGDGMRRLDEMGLAGPVKKLVENGKPFMGICLGMQLLMESSEEAPGVRGLGVFKGAVRRFEETEGLKIPHMGWNTVAPTENGAEWFEAPPRHFYFVHSYRVVPENPAVAAGTTEYGVEFVSALAADNIFATQFHPEKSQDDGLELLRKFIERARRDS